MHFAISVKYRMKIIKKIDEYFNLAWELKKGEEQESNGDTNFTQSVVGVVWNTLTISS